MRDKNCAGFGKRPPLSCHSWSVNGGAVQTEDDVYNNNNNNSNNSNSNSNSNKNKKALLLQDCVCQVPCLLA